MKFLTATLLTLLLAFVSGLYLPWWGIAIVALLVAAIVHQKAGKAFLSGFLGLFLLWGGLAFWIDMKNDHILSQKIAAILPLGGNSILLILVTALVGGLVAGFAALSGSFLRASAK
ncbi:MAG TPA: hypothetical protein PK695_11810 [Chitinophagaceae bacterium]|jgi:hypothetical protein|nr:MAG: hypothetical protein BWZ05_01879 [Bacteroidetes bacterium ADurb.BinA245]HMW66901.1 hypothetical protein [Chitinophagaceae bacterium]HNA19297.1 hypothetical protein [Chitinophagaceae bacterium]HNA91481.1 hypothetical protein [Chitinophagaceae bacterium]HNC39865.1 hypothetical protein [Chitinophagaceae bacterium]